MRRAASVNSVSSLIKPYISIQCSIIISSPNAVIEGRVIRTYERQYDPEYSHTLLVKVTDVFYDEIDEIKVGDVVEIKICSLSKRIKRKKIYHLTGSRECGSNELEISSNGVFADVPLGAGPCTPYIKAGSCDDPR